MTGEVALRRIKTLLHFDYKPILQIAWQTAESQTDSLTAPPLMDLW